MNDQNCSSLSPMHLGGRQVDFGSHIHEPSANVQSIAPSDDLSTLAGRAAVVSASCELPQGLVGSHSTDESQMQWQHYRPKGRETIDTRSPQETAENVDRVQPTAGESLIVQCRNLGAECQPAHLPLTSSRVKNSAGHSPLQRIRRPDLQPSIDHWHRSTARKESQTRTDQGGKKHQNPTRKILIVDCQRRSPAAVTRRPNHHSHYFPSCFARDGHCFLPSGNTLCRNKFGHMLQSCRKSEALLWKKTCGTVHPQSKMPSKEYG